MHIPCRRVQGGVQADEHTKRVKGVKTRTCSAERCTQVVTDRLKNAIVLCRTHRRDAKGVFVVGLDTPVKWCSHCKKAHDIGEFGSSLIGPSRKLSCCEKARESRRQAPKTPKTVGGGGSTTSGGGGGGDGDADVTAAAAAGSGGAAEELEARKEKGVEMPTESPPKLVVGTLDAQPSPAPPPLASLTHNRAGWYRGHPRPRQTSIAAASGSGSQSHQPFNFDLSLFDDQVEDPISPNAVAVVVRAAEWDDDAWR